LTPHARAVGRQLQLLRVRQARLVVNGAMIRVMLIGGAKLPVGLCVCE
jgi:hypothetical protein